MLVQKAKRPVAVNLMDAREELDPRIRGQGDRVAHHEQNSRPDGIFGDLRERRLSSGICRLRLNSLPSLSRKRRDVIPDLFLSPCESGAA